MTPQAAADRRPTSSVSSARSSRPTSVIPVAAHTVRPRSWCASCARKAKAAGVLTPHVLEGGAHLHHREVALVLRAAGLSPLGPVAVNVAAPDEGNMYLLGKRASDGAAAPLPRADDRGRGALGLLHDRTRGGERRGQRSVDDADDGGARRQPLADRRAQGVHHRRGGREGRHRHGEGRRRRDHVPGRSAGSRHPHRAGARHDRLVDARRPRGGDDRRAAGARRSDAGGAGRGVPARAGPARPRAADPLHALARRVPFARTRSRPITPAAARRSASRWSTTRASASCWPRT